MALKSYLTRQLRIRERFGLQLVAIIVAAHGVFILATTLLDLLVARHTSRLGVADVDLPLIIGLSLLYLSALLRRRKPNRLAGDRSELYFLSRLEFDRFDP